MKTCVIIPSGGKGTRLNSELPKQYVKILGKEIIAYTLEVFQNSDFVDEIVISAQKEYFELLNNIKKKHSFSKIINVVEGGSERQDSVYNGLKSLNAGDNDLIVVHDAARPLLSKEVLNEAIKKALIFDNIIVAIRAKDTLFKGDENIIEHVDRKNFFYAQTPQIFKYRNISDAFEKAKKDNFYGTDESMLLRRASYDVGIFEGNSFNFKITTDEDMEIFKAVVGNKV